jgi:hypothetical protein
MKLLMEYERVTQNVLFGDATVAALISGRKYDVIPKNSNYSRESNMRTLVVGNKFHYENAAPLQNSIWKRFTFR